MTAGSQAMRKRTLAIFCSVLAIVGLLALRLVGFSVPFGLAPLMVFLVLVPLLMVPMTLLNKRLLAWRRQRGRDIEEEETYEHEGAGIIRLRPKSQAEIEEDEKRYLHPALR
jgi:hypothetical protein